MNTKNELKSRIALAKYKSEVLDKASVFIARPRADIMVKKKISPLTVAMYMMANSTKEFTMLDIAKTFLMTVRDSDVNRYMCGKINKDRYELNKMREFDYNLMSKKVLGYTSRKEEGTNLHYWSVNREVFYQSFSEFVEFCYNKGVSSSEAVKYSTLNRWIKETFVPSTYGHFDEVSVLRIAELNKPNTSLNFLK